MADKAAEIVASWRNKLPPRAPKGDVERVLVAEFPESWSEPQGGSHILLLEHECLNQAQALGFRVLYPGGNLSIPVCDGGRYVKAIYIKRLLTAIDVRGKYEERENDEQSHGE